MRIKLRVSCACRGRTAQEMADHPMYELDNRKDQLMSALRICLVNVLQWLRDTVSPTGPG